jgi:hypothetical protein
MPKDDNMTDPTPSVTDLATRAAVASSEVAIGGSEGAQPLAPPVRMAGTLLPSAQKLQLMEKVATYIVSSGEFERKFRGRGDPKAKAMMMLIKADSLGISINDALEHVYVIDGKTGLSGQMMLRLINERCPGRTFAIEESTDKICRVLMGRPGEPPKHFEFSIERATKAGLLERKKDGEVKPNFAWHAYAQEMLQWRAIAKGARVMFPEILQGCYLLDELTSGPDLSEAGEWAVKQVVEESSPPAQEPEKTKPKSDDPARKELRSLNYAVAGLSLEADGYVPNKDDWDDRFKSAAKKVSEDVCQDVLGHVPEGEPDLTPDQIERMRIWLKTRKRDALLGHICRLALLSRGVAPASPEWSDQLAGLRTFTWNGMCSKLIGSPVAPDFEMSETLIDQMSENLAEMQKHLKEGGKL